MDYIHQSLIEKVAQKDAITPYEVVYLEYLESQHRKNQTPDIKIEPNYYLAMENRQPLVEPYQWWRLATFQNRQDRRQYEVFHWAAVLMTKFDAVTKETGYRGLALLNELRYMRDEKSLETLWGLHKGEPTTGAIFDYVAYSHYHQRNATYTEVLEAFGFEFQCLLLAANNVLVLNYYLEGMVPLEDFHFTKQLKMWLAQHGGGESAVAETDEEESSYNFTKICHEATREKIIVDNHPNFVQFISHETSKLGIMLSSVFEEGSLRYVNDSLAKIFGPEKQVPPPTTTAI